MLTLKINNQRFSGWTEVRITAGIRQAARGFQIAVTDKWMGKRWQVLPFDACELYLGDHKVLTGWVEGVNHSIDESQQIITLAGRAKTADLIDCTAKAKQFRNQTALQIANALAKPHGVAVRADVAITKRIPSWKPDEGATVFESIETLARLAGLLVTDNADGDLVLTRAGISRVHTPLVLGENIKALDATYDVSSLYSDYIIKGQQKGSDTVDAVAAAHVTAAANDYTVKRYRPIVLNAEDQIDLKAASIRSNWEKNTRFGNSQQFNVTVQGWQHETGLWQPNQLVRLKADELGLNADLLIVQVEYLLNDDNGTTAQLSLSPKAAFEPEPLSADVQQATKPEIWKELN